MDSTTLLIALACLLVGLVVGSLLTRTLAPQEKKRRELETKLRRAEDEHKAYQQQVTEHFLKTSGMLRDMTQSYRNLGEHLASGAMVLATSEVSREVLDASSPKLSDKSAGTGALLSATNAEPPKDYAPSVPGGVLSENYGFGEDGSDPNNLYTRGLATKPSGVANDNDDEDDPTLKVG